MDCAKSYYLGLDIGTDSVGYAVTDTEYDLLKHGGEPMWGVHLFDEASLSSERRRYRSARRRLDRRQQRVKLVQELFAKEIAGIDTNFYRRIKESALWREDAQDAHCLFDSPDYTDADYYRKYPTIHHLICELMSSTDEHDVRLVYLACAWLVAHRGHFLSDISKDNLEDFLNVEKCYRNLMELFDEWKPWDCDAGAFGNILKKKLGVNGKYKQLCGLLYDATRVPKGREEQDDGYYSIEHILKLLCGGTVSARDLFRKEEYEPIPPFTLEQSDDDLMPILEALGDDAELIFRLKALFDWAILADILSESLYISEKKVAIYTQHKQDLHILKRMVRKYIPKQYTSIFRDEHVKGYAFYLKNRKQTDFCMYLKNIFKAVEPEEQDISEFQNLLAKIEANTLCPMQIGSDNRVIPNQLYWMELKRILDNACVYLPFINETDEDGYTVKDKLLSIMEFRIPYFVGPLNRASCFSWMERKVEGKIMPWNFSQKIDLDKSEQAFINAMTNTCTYLPYADVLPKCSLLHEKFQVLNEINTLSVHGQRIPVELKQRLFFDLFLKKKKVSMKSVKEYFLQNGFYTKSDLNTLSGIDENVKSSLRSHIAFKRLIKAGVLTDSEAEEIIRRSTYTEDRGRFVRWVNQRFNRLSDEDRAYIARMKFKDFARVSRELLCDIYGTEGIGEIGEPLSIIKRMWDENVNLMEVLSERYTYGVSIQAARESYFLENPKNLSERMTEMSLSNAVKRPVIRALDIISDVIKVRGCAPEKLFIEMARGGTPESKGKRTRSRYMQLKELYAKCELEEVREMESCLEKLGEERDNRLQAEKVFLYFLQLGRSMYSDRIIDFEHLSDKTYDIDHIYPQSKVKDDSIWNNKVLVLSEENGAKDDNYPIAADIRHNMHGWWRLLLDHGLITVEKYKRLIRHTPFDENEQWGFINRQLVETRQSAKALATLLRERYPKTQIVYVKAGLVAEFRQEFDMIKSRVVNDLHHAKDAYLNIVVGNVYSEKFTRRWFLENRTTYNLKIGTLFSRTVTVDGRVIWKGNVSIDKVKRIVQYKNAVHLTRYAYTRKGGLFDQQPKSAAKGLVPRKVNLPAEKYGGYNRKTAIGFVLVRFNIKKKQELMLVAVELICANCMKEKSCAIEYLKGQIEEILEKPVSNLEFPLGLRLIRLHTVFEVDGLRMSIASKSNKGKTVVFSILMPLIVGYSDERYIKYLERYQEKKKEYPNMRYCPKHDQITPEKNMNLYNLLMDKLCVSVFRLRPGKNPCDLLQKSVDTFQKLDIDSQVQVLLQMVSLFGRNTGGCNLGPIGGGAKECAPTMSACLSNWKKKYTDVRILDCSASGLFESRSGNLLELL